MTVVFRVLHVLWAMPCVVVGIGLATAKGGHPPGIIFVPLVLAAWIVGHLSLGLTQWLLGRGLRAHGFNRASEASWPPAILVCLVSCGIVFLSGLAVITKGVLFDRPLPAIWWSLIAVWSTPPSAL